MYWEAASTPAYLAKSVVALLGVPKSLLAFLSFPGVVHGVQLATVTDSNTFL